jgi:hypothetical protein
MVGSGSPVVADVGNGMIKFGSSPQHFDGRRISSRLLLRQHPLRCGRYPKALQKMAAFARAAPVKIMGPSAVPQDSVHPQ